MIIYALDFDGVLVDSAGETAQSGLRGAKILWPDAVWIPNTIDDESSPIMQSLLDRFRMVRPVLYVGWESIVIVKLLLDPEVGQPTTDDILNNFHTELKDKVIKGCGCTDHDLNRAMKEARDKWIDQNDATDWIHAHNFFEGACKAVKKYLDTKGNENIYVITTKTKEFAERLLQEQGLYSNDNSSQSNVLKVSHIYGLGSGSKAEVLQSILKQRDGDIAVMVEDNIDTLDNIMASPIQHNVLPVVAAWGYNTKEQLALAKKQGYVMLSEDESSSLSSVLSDDEVKVLYDRHHS